MKESEILTESSGYKQELKRNLKLFSSFAVAFSFISITTGIFTNYQFLLTTAGPAGIWSWIITAVGQILVGLIFAELSGVIPISGYSYQWIKRLSTPMMGWITGWGCFCLLVLLVPTVDWGLAPIIASLVGIIGSPAQISGIVIVTLIIQATLNIVGVKLATLINNAAVFTESVGILVLTVVLIVVAFKNGNNPAILFTTGNTGHGISYVQPFIMSLLLGAFTLVGFETSANLSEETVNAEKTVPKAVISSITISGIFGMLFLIAVTFAISNLAKTTASGNPIPYILQSNLGPVVGKIFLVIVSISIFACSTVIMTSGARLIYAMSRDNVFFASKVFSKVSVKTASPYCATLLILVLGIVATLFSNSLTTLVGVTSVLPGTIYLTTVVCYGLARKNVEIKKGCFNLGKAAKPVFILATIWLVFELCVLTIPKNFHTTTLITIALIFVGFALYFMFFRKSALAEVDKYIEDDSNVEEIL